MKGDNECIIGICNLNWDQETPPRPLLERTERMLVQTSGHGTRVTTDT